MMPSVRVGFAAAVGLLALASAVPMPLDTANSGCPDSAVIRNAAASVVAVTMADGNRPETAVGFVIATDRVLTVAHAVLSSSDVRVTIPGQGNAEGATLMSLDLRRDLAILDVRGLNSSAVLQPARGTFVASSCATMLTVRGGHVVTVDGAVRRSVEVIIDAPSRAHRSALELSAVVGRGDSGAPVIDGSGRVEGVMFAASSSGPPTGWAVDASELRALLASSLAG